MDDTSATLKQAKQILDIIAQTGASSKDVQSVIASGTLTDIFRASRSLYRMRNFDRRDFQVLVGITERFNIHIAPDNASGIEVQLRDGEPPQKGVLGGHISPVVSPHDAIIEVIPSDIIPGCSEGDTILSTLSRLEKLKYRVATTHELIAFFRQHSSAALSKDGIIGGTLSTKSFPSACLMLYWHTDHGPRLFLRSHTEKWCERWWVAVVRF